MSGKPQGPAVRRDCRCPKVTHRHGTVQAYNRDRCRCDGCRQAIADESRRAYRLKTYGRWDGMTPADGARRRLQALATLGWSGPLLSADSGLASSCINRIRLGRTTRITPTTAAAIRETYDRLWNTRAPHGPGQLRGYNEVVNLARKRRWVGPLAWDDDTIDDPSAKPYRQRSRVPAAEREALDEIAISEACFGRKVELTNAERAEAVRQLTERGYSARAAAEFLCTTPRLITRKRASNRVMRSGGGGVAA